MPVHRHISPPNMRRFHKPCKMRESLLTERGKWCIIYRMFVFGRSLLPSAGVGTKRKECKGFGASDGSDMVRCRAKGGAPHLSAHLGRSARWAFALPPFGYGGLFSAALHRSFTVHSPCLSRERDGGFVMPCALRVTVLSCAAPFSRRLQAYFH